MIVARRPTIEFCSRPYVRSHMREPHGYGTWAFAIAGSSLDLLWSPPMTYTDAKAWARGRVRMMIADGAISALLPYIVLEAQP